MLTINYFASIREALGKSQEQLELPSGVKSVADLIAHLAAGSTRFRALIENEGKILVAVNQTVVGREHLLLEHDEIAFFPPMTGG